MAKTELKLKSKNAATGQDITTTLSYVNPTADSATLKTFGQKLNTFTTNNYVETDRVQTINVDTEATPKTTSTIALSKNSYNQRGNAIWIPEEDIQTNSNAAFSNFWGVLQYDISGSGIWRYLDPRQSSGKNYLFADNVDITGSANATIRVAINETDTNSAAVLVKSITLTNN